MIKKHENKEGKNPMDFFIQEVLIAKKMLEEKRLKLRKLMVISV